MIKPHYYDSFIGKYPINKTIQFSLIPQGDTQKFIDHYGFVSADERRSQDYKTLKTLIDNYHRTFIERTLRELRDQMNWSDLIDALTAYQKAAGETAVLVARRDLEKMQEEYRLAISDAFKRQDDYNDLFGKKLITKILPQVFDESETKELLSRFQKFTSFFIGFYDNRKNLYSDEAKATAIAHRIVNENFPRFYSNCNNWELLNTTYTDFALEVQSALEQLDPNIDVAQYFEPDNYSLVLTQKGIDTYNMILGGGFDDAGKKVPGLNNLSNEHWQKAHAAVKIASPHEDQQVDAAPPKIILSQLYRQLLSERVSSWSQLFDQYKDDGDVRDALEMLIHEILSPQGEETSRLDQTAGFFNQLNECNLADIKIRSSRFHRFSQICFGEGFYLDNAIKVCTDEMLFPLQGLNARERKNWSKKEYRSLQEIAQIIAAAEDRIKKADADTKTRINEQAWTILHLSKLIDKISDHKLRVLKTVPAVKDSLNAIKPDEHKLMQNGELIQIIKSFLDNMLDFQRDMQLFALDSNEERNPEFYAYYDYMCDAWAVVPSVYNCVRNYVTQKPYSKEKFKLTFNNPTFLSGWDRDKQNENFGSLFLREGNYYLGVLNPEAKIKFESLQDSEPDGNAISDGTVASDGITIPDGTADQEGIAANDKTHEVYQKVDYKLFPGATKMIPKCTIALKEVSAHFKENTTDYILESKKFIKPLRIPYNIFDMNYEFVDDERVARDPKKYQIAYKRDTGDEAGFTQALADWIDFCLDFLESYSATSIYDFSTCREKPYEQLDQFYHDIDRITYSLTLRPVSKTQIDELIASGQLFFFQIYNKDFAQKATGKKNLHTLYFEALFSQQNLAQTIFKLDGEAEMFYRPASIDNPFSHNPGEYVVNRTYEQEVDGVTEIKNLSDTVHKELYDYANGKTDRTHLSDEALAMLESGKVVIKQVEHAITKDKRFTKPQYSLHIPITLNFGTKPMRNLDNNSDILKCIKQNSDVALIGIDRGERNLLYYSVINQNGDILEQGSLNVINGVDYQEKLTKREQERYEQRKSWKSIDKIKDLKKGYLSLAVHEIVELMLKYNAVVVMEDLNSGFKRSRTKFEKQVYQNFEKQLIDKLNYCARKPSLPIFDEETSTVNNDTLEHGDGVASEFTVPGGILQGYQLANQFESFQKLGKQSGSIFYVPAWKTSHIDPTTGFVNLFRASDLKYQNIAHARAFFERFDAIIFNQEESRFEFSFAYHNFHTSGTSFKDQWTVCSCDDELPTVKRISEPGKQAAFINAVVDTTAELKMLCKNYDIAYESGENLIGAITAINQAPFYKSLLSLFRFIVTLRYSTKTDVRPVIDCIVSPVKNKEGFYFDSRIAPKSLPQDADANGAYNIALKGLQMIQENVDEATDKPWRITYPKNQNANWLRFIQERSWLGQ